MGIRVANVPAPVPVQGLAARIRSVTDEGEIKICGTRGSVNAAISEAGCIATTDIATTIATDPIAERPHGPNASPRIRTTVASVAKPEPAARIKYTVGRSEIAREHAAKATTQKTNAIAKMAIEDLLVLLWLSYRSKTPMAFADESIKPRAALSSAPILGTVFEVAERKFTPASVSPMRIRAVSAVAVVSAKSTHCARCRSRHAIMERKRTATIVK